MARASVVAGLVRDGLTQSGVVEWQALGSSMRGAIDDGEVVRLVPPHPELLRTGAVVMALLDDDRLVIHRIRRVAGLRLELRGDSRTRSDPLVPAAAVLGVVQPTPRPSPRTLLHRLVP